ncbi:MAG: DNA repair protein RadA [Phycisphaerales bacterium]
MARARQVFVCRACGSAQGRWLGKCPDCGTWDALEAERVDTGAKRDPQKGLVEAWTALADGEGGVAVGAAAEAKPIAEVGTGEGTPRIATGVGELDRVLGGGAETARGLVPGSAVLIGGAPGIGKSTLLLQAAMAMAGGAAGTRVLYVSSEESAEQVKSRAERLGAAALLRGEDAASSGTRGASSGTRNLFLLADTNLARIVEQTRKVMPAVLVIDSVQMVYKSDVPAAPGSLTQLRRCCAELTFLAKASGIAVVMVGHITKDGQLAGPRLLEHLVDAVLSFEGDRYHAHRLVRAVKNRFGTTQEIGIFEMTGAGLREVPEGAGVAALDIGQGRRPGSVVCPAVSGTRCMLVEVQALTATGFVGAAKRKTSGLDPSRVAMLVAVLEQHAELRLADRDIFASAVGGVRVVEPASDLAVLLAVAGAHLRKSLPEATCAVGEVGLGGEMRPVTQVEMRIREAARLGYRRVIVPGRKRSARGGAEGAEKIAERVADKIEIVPVRSVGRAMEELG